MIWNEDFDPKIRTFWVFGGGGKEKWRCVVVCWVSIENSTQRELTHVGAKLSFQLGASNFRLVKSRIREFLYGSVLKHEGAFVIENERILLFTQMVLLIPKVKVENALTHVNSRSVS
jgi:hypothetical protein